MEALEAEGKFCGARKREGALGGGECAFGLQTSESDEDSVTGMLEIQRHSSY